MGVGVIVFLALTVGLRISPIAAVVLAVVATEITYVWHRRGRSRLIRHSN
jgi:hypothetical protein